MWHDKRRFAVGTVETAEELAEKLRQHTWTLCTGFRFNGHLWLNDSISEDSIEEYALVRESDMHQIETLTVGWMDEAKIVKWATEPEEFNPYPITNEIDSLKDHGTCYLCR